MRKIRCSLCVLLSSAALTSCGCHDEACQLTGIGVKVSGFTLSDLTGAVVRRYDSGSSFTRLHDTLVARIEQGSTDTFLSGLTFANGYDDECYFPAVHKTVRLQHFHYDVKSETVCHSIGEKLQACLSPVTAFEQDGVLQRVDSPSQYVIIYK